MNSLEQARETIRRCRLLAGFSERPGETTRTFLSKPMRDVHTAFARWMTGAGMTVRVDAAGNIRGVRAASGSKKSSRSLFVGSHLDTVPAAGAFDGVLGVVIGVALAELLNDRALPYAIEVVGFSDEEGVRFGEPFIGSRAFVGTLDGALLDRRDDGNRSVADAIRDYGLDPQRIPDVRVSENAIGYLEFHIEQGPVLDDLNLPLAVVDAIVGQTRVDVSFSGMANHAGTTPMRLRRDALAGAAEWIGAVEREALAVEHLVATVGRATVAPGASNVVPSHCELSLDVRHPKDAIRHSAVDRISRIANEIASRRQLEVGWHVRVDQGAVEMDPRLTGALADAAAEVGFPVHCMPSGAGHDAMIVAARMPTAMLFIRCEKGISHHPAESVRDSDVAAALDAGLRFVDRIAQACA